MKLTHDDVYVDTTHQSKNFLNYALVEDHQIRMEWTMQAYKNIVLELYKVIGTDSTNGYCWLNQKIKDYIDKPFRLVSDNQFNISALVDRIYLTTVVDYDAIPENFWDNDPIPLKLQMIYLYNWRKEDKKKIISNFKSALSKLSKDILIRQDQSILDNCS